MGDNENIVDFESGKQTYIQKRKDARADDMRQAFRAARGESTPKPVSKSRKRRNKPGKK